MPITVHLLAAEAAATRSSVFSAGNLSDATPIFVLTRTIETAFSSSVYTCEHGSFSIVIAPHNPLIQSP
jgi:predicted naringenin-chalcone synthase